MRSLLLLVLAALTSIACGTASEGGLSGPSINGRITERDDEPAIQSNDILARDALTQRALVQHILIGWGDLEGSYKGHVHERAKNRTRREADALAVELLERARKGEDMEKMMKTYSEDTGSAERGTPYEVTTKAALVFEFRRMSLRLNVGEVGLVKSIYGWHIIKRIE